MEMFKVESSCINEIGWENDKLYVKFSSGLYVYDNIKREVFLAMLGAKSRGRFFLANIKNKYSYKKI